MKAKRIIITILVAALILVATAAFAQGWKGYRGSGGWGLGTPYTGLFNPSTVETIAGEVQKVEAVVPMKGMNTGVQLILKSDKETIPVHMGPGWYIERLDTKIEKGDKVEIRGSRVNFGGKPAIIAAEIRKGNAALMLRDSSGIPVWAGWRR